MDWYWPQDNRTKLIERDKERREKLVQRFERQKINPWLSEDLYQSFTLSSAPQASLPTHVFQSISCKAFNMGRGSGAEGITESGKWNDGRINMD